MTWYYFTLVLTLLTVVSCDTFLEEEEGDPRLGYVSVGSDGTTSITFNATSIQNAVILGLFVLVLGALVLPLFGISLGSLLGKDEGSDSGYGYGYDEGAGYDAGAGYSNQYQSLSKRSTEMLGPVLDALNSAEEKYRK